MWVPGPRTAVLKAWNAGILTYCRLVSIGLLQSITVYCKHICFGAAHGARDQGVEISEMMAVRGLKMAMACPPPPWSPQRQHLSTKTLASQPAVAYPPLMHFSAKLQPRKAAKFRLNNRTNINIDSWGVPKICACVCVCMYTYIYMYMYIYVYLCTFHWADTNRREREIERERDANMEASSSWARVCFPASESSRWLM